MYTYIEILSGSDKGMTFRVRPGLRVGSGNCDIQLKENSVPPLHSQVMLDQEDRFVLVCTNAVYEMKTGSQTVKKILLQKGMVIQIGNAFIGVKSSTELLPGAIDPLLIKKEEQKLDEKLLEEKTETKLLNSKITEIDTPKKILIEELKQLVEKSLETRSLKITPIHFKLFKNPVQLKVESGPNADDEYIVTWGPRDFGPMSLEYPIEYPPFPDILFTLTPNEEGEIIFTTKHPKFCKVMGQSQSSSILKDGSQIIAGNSTIYIKYLNETNLEK